MSGISIPVCKASSLVYENVMGMRTVLMDQMKMVVVSTLPVKIVIFDNQLADNGGYNNLLIVLYTV